MNNAKILQRKLRKLFPDKVLRDQVLEVLNSYGEESHEQEPDRVRLAILKISGEVPTLEEVRSYTKAAKVDFRDVLWWAECPRQSKHSSMPEGPEKKALKIADKKEYEDWLYA